MFIGHFGVALAAKRAAPRTSLGALFLAAQFVDLLWPLLLLLGLERVAIRPEITRVTPLDFESYPISHSLVMAAVWGAVLGLLYWTVTRYVRGAVVIAAAVASHWVLDLIVHRPDLPLAFGDSAKVGLGLWSSPAATVAIEGTIFVAGIALYASATRARDRIGSVGLWGLAGFPSPHLRGEPVRPAAGKRAADRVGRPRAVAPRALGVVGGPPSAPIG